MSDEQKENTETTEIRAGRGPAHPYLNFERAVEKITIVADKGAARQKMPPETFYSLWKMGAKSSSSRQSMAALNQYGLVEYVGKGRDRRVQLTDLALRIVLDKRPDSPERKAALQEAALGPSIFKELHEKYAPFLPADVIIETFLTLDRSFSEDAAKTVVKHFKDTIAYAGLDKPTDTPENELNNLNDSDNEGAVENETPTVKIGDKIQATVQGFDQFAEGAIVEGLSEDGQYVFVDQYDSGVPIKDVTIMETAQIETPPAPPAKPANLMMAQNTRLDAPLPEGTRKAMFPLDEGDVTLTFPEGLAEDSLEDLGAYLEIFLKKEIKKSKAVYPTGGDSMDNQ